MKPNYFFAIIFAISSISKFTEAQNPTWQWARGAGGALFDGAYSVATDPAGNVYVAGYFESASITFGTFVLNNASADTGDVFLVKYDAGGNVQWARRAGGTGHDRATGVACDASGFVYLAGTYESSTIIFDFFTLNNASSYSDVFMVKYDQAGAVVWADRAGGIYEDGAEGLTADAAGNFAVTGYFQSAPITFGTLTLTNSGNYDMFVVGYNGSLTPQWAQSAGGSGEERGYSVAFDGAGNTIVAGAFQSTSITIGTTTLNYAGGAYTDIFLAKYNTGGNPVWARAAGGTYLDEPNSVTADGAGNIYMVGVAYSTSITFGTTILTNSGSNFYCDLFVVKYDAAGTVQWAKGTGAGTNNDVAYSVSLDVLQGNVYVSGIFGNPITFDSFTLNGGGIFVVRYNSSGTATWATSVANGGGNAVTVDPFGDVLLAGAITGTSITFGSTTLSNAGIYDMYAAKLDVTTGVNDGQTSIGSVVYPNPFSWCTTIGFGKSLLSAELIIYDIYGQAVDRVYGISGNEVRVERGDIVPGVYFYEVKGEGLNGIAGKFIVVD